MRKIIFVCFLCFISCENKTTSKYIPKSNGNINTLSVVMEKQLWNSKLGDSVRKIFSTEYVGLPQQEPVLSLKHIPISVFSGFFRESRNILLIQKNKNTNWDIKRNQFAKPQSVFIVSGKDDRKIISAVKEKKEMIVEKVKQNELVEKQRRMGISTYSNSPLKKLLNIDLLMPSVYTLFKKGSNNEIWIQKETKKGTINIIVLQIEDQISLDEFSLQNIIKLRDSIGQAFVPGRKEGSYMITEKAYKPYVKKTRIKGFNAIETRGTWELKNDFMAGPFLNYIISDTVNSRLLVVEGFVFSPSSRKRDMIFELEAIFKSLKIYKKD